MELYYFFSGLFSGTISLSLGFLVLYKDRKNGFVKIFASLCFFIASYLFFYMFWPFAKTHSSALFINQITTLCHIPVPVLFLHFIVSWLGIYEKNKKVIMIAYGVSIVSLFLTFTPYFIKDMVPKFGVQYWPEPGILYHCYTATLFLIIIYSFYLLFKHYRLSSGVRKAQIKYIIIAAILGYIGASSNLFWWYNINIPPYAFILVSFWTIFITYAIVAHRLLDIKFVLRRSSVYLFSFITILVIVIPIKLLFHWKFTNYNISDSLNSTLLIDFLFLIFALAIFQPIKNRYYHLANKYFFSSLYDSQKIISDLSRHLRSTLDTKRIYSFVRSILVDSMHVKTVSFFIYQRDKNSYIIQANGGINTNNQKEFSINDLLRKHYIMRNRIIVVGELKRDHYEEYKETIDLLHQRDIEILVPLGVKNRTIGLIALGQKESLDPYNNEDIRVLGIISGLSASVIENANLYQETKDKNIKMKELLEMKTDFLRVANHQLNTPLSIMRNALEAVKDGTLPLERSLEIANKGLERISDTLSDFWSAMDLEGERDKSNLIKTNIEKIIYEIVDEKKESEGVKQKSLQLNIKKPDYDLPFVVCDSKKIAYVINSLVNNAIFYTAKGEIDISFETITYKETEYLKIYVSDTGAGIGSSDKKNLFKKFSRGKGASKLHPDGSGLGLYISKKIVEDSLGRLKLENTAPNVGTTFSVTLPVQK